MLGKTGETRFEARCRCLRVAVGGVDGSNTVSLLLQSCRHLIRRRLTATRLFGGGQDPLPFRCHLLVVVTPLGDALGGEELGVEFLDFILAIGILAIGRVIALAPSRDPSFEGDLLAAAATTTISHLVRRWRGGEEKGERGGGED